MMSANNSSATMRYHQEVASVATSSSSFHGGCVASSSGGGGAGGGVLYNGKSAGGSTTGVFDNCSTPLPRFQPNLHGMSMEWTPEEQLILDEGTIRYASESNIARYAKIAMHLDNKTIRDVALRSRWMNRRDFSKRRKEDLNLIRRSKDRKDKTLDPSATSSHGVMQASFPPYAQGVVANFNDDGFSYNGVGGVTWQLLRQNIQAFEQISANLTTHQIHGNIGLLCRTRENILQILQNLKEPLNSGKRMPPLPVKLNEELANSILPPSTLGMR